MTHTTLRLHVTYWNGTRETFKGTERAIERMAHTLSAKRTVRTVTIEG